MAENLTNSKWHSFQKPLFRVIAAFVLLFVCSFSFPHAYIPDIGSYTHVFFERMVQWVGKNILHIKKPYTIELVSDSTGMYIHVMILFIVAIVAATLWGVSDKKASSNYQANYYWFVAFIRYYVAMQLLVYGWNKIFKWQFYLPEPNTLFTTLGNTPKDLLYWSTMGMSRSYSVFTGLLEVLAAMFLFFRRTQLLGAFIAAGVMVNVLMINLSFDISVKLYSSFLLFLCLLILFPDAKRIAVFFFSARPIGPHQSTVQYLLFKKRWLYRTVKTIVIAFLLFDSLAVYLSSKNFNDDKAVRPYLHGAYSVEAFVVGGDTLLPLTTDTYRWRRMFIHRQGYLITQLMNDEMKDYELEIDSLHHEFVMRDPEDSSLHVLHYINTADSVLELRGRFLDDSLSIYLKKIDLQKLPLLQNEFQWTIDK